jgi:hypothetical protein
VVDTITATSPDGRSWRIDALKEPYSFGGDGGFSWAVLIATVIVFLVMLGLAFVSWYFAIGAAVILLIWVGERVSNHLRPRFRARTEGPPAEEVTWKATSFGGDKLGQKVAGVIAAGNVEVEPGGLRLLSHQHH